MRPGTGCGPRHLAAGMLLRSPQSTAWVHQELRPCLHMVQVLQLSKRSGIMMKEAYVSVPSRCGRSEACPSTRSCGRTSCSARILRSWHTSSTVQRCITQVSVYDCCMGSAVNFARLLRFRHSCESRWPPH